MKTWPDWHELWSAVENTVRVPCPPFTGAKEWALVVAKIEEREEATRSQVDRACRRWAATYEWPKRLTGEVRWFVHLRVVGALTHSLTLMTPHEKRAVLMPAEGVTERMLNEWFLIDVWPCSWARLRAELRGGSGERLGSFEPGSS